MQNFKNKFTKFLYWFIHNEIATPLFIVALIIVSVILSPFYLIYYICNYFYRYYCRVNGLF
jgi:hypothetical protein